MHAVTGHEKKIAIWKVGTGKGVRSFEIKTEGNKPRSGDHIAVSVDKTSSIIIGSTTDKVLKVRDFTNGKCLIRIPNSGLTTNMIFTPDNKNIITASGNFQIIFFEY